MLFFDAASCLPIYSATPLDMYVFGYTLVHAPVQWELNADAELLDVLASSVMDHLPSDGKIAGSINCLHPQWNDVHFDKLPESVRRIIYTINCSYHRKLLITGVSSLPNLRHFECHCDYENLDGVQVDFKTLTNNIESLTLHSLDWTIIQETVLTFLRVPIDLSA